MTTLNEMGSAKTNGTQATMRATEKIMNYCHTHSDATILYSAFHMQLHIHRNES